MTFGAWALAALLILSPVLFLWYLHEIYSQAWNKGYECGRNTEKLERLMKLEGKNGK